LKVTPFFFMVLPLYFHELPGAHVCASQKQKPFASSFDSSAMCIQPVCMLPPALSFEGN